MARGVQIDATVTGPFFQYGAVAIEDATKEWVADMIREGEAKVEAQLYEGHGVATGAYKRSIHGRMPESRYGVISAGRSRQEAIIGAWLEGGRSRNERHRFRGYGMYRQARAHLNRIARELGGHVYARATRRLT